MEFDVKPLRLAPHSCPARYSPHWFSQARFPSLPSSLSPRHRHRPLLTTDSRSRFPSTRRCHQTPLLPPRGRWSLPLPVLPRRDHLARGQPRLPSDWRIIRQDGKSRD